MKLKHPKIDSVVLLGGGQLLLEIIDELIKYQLNIKVITSPRHAVEIFQQNSFLLFYL